MDELTRQRVKRLRQYAAWEEEHYPDDRLHVLDWAAGEIERLRDENKRMRQLLPVTWESESGATLTVREDAEWFTHDSHQPPFDLAPAQLVELQAPTTGGVFAIRRVDELPWHPGLRYRPALSASGLPLCSAEGLGPEPRYVFRNGDDNEYWTARRPTPTRKGLWQMPSGPWGYAPSTHRKPGPKSESLMEVWRD